MTPPPISRRALLGGTAGAAALLALPPGMRAALAAPVQPGSLQDVEHVVIFMQENRAFDHYFGTLQGVRGFGDRAAVRGVNGRSIFHQPDPTKAEGYTLPFAMNVAHTRAYRSGAPAFGYVDTLPLWNEGLGDGYVTRRGSGWLGQGFYEPADMPFYNALASLFTICDQYHASVQCNTNTNRDHFMTGTSGGTVRDLPVTNNSYIPGGYEWTTYAERLQAAGVSWKTYQAKDNYDDNALAWFAPFQKAKPGEPLHDRGMARVGTTGDGHAMGDALVRAFAADVASGALPQVSWIVAPEALSEHASWAPPDGEHLTARLMNAVAEHPEVWARTVFILNYDEHGGFFDHCLPPVPPPGAGRGASTVSTDGELVMRVDKGSSSYFRVVNHEGRYKVDGAWSDTLPDGESVISGPHTMGLGVRVPMIVVSPWTRGGVVDSTVYDHTSTLRLLERRFGVAEPNISPWRRAVTGDLMSVFDFSGQDPVWPRVPDTSGNRQKVVDSEKRPSPSVPSPQVFPRQQRGTRTQRPLPYRLAVTPAVEEGKVTLTFANSGTLAAVFHVYPEPGVLPRFYTVEPGRSLSDGWEFGESGYDLRVHGPNGYLWHFRGGRSEGVDVTFEGPRRIEVRNRDKTRRTVLVGDLAYGAGVREERVQGHAKRTFRLEEPAEGWYDLAVGVSDDPFFLRRHAGKVPGDGQGVTDPAMGLPDALTAGLRLAPASTMIDEPGVRPGRPTTVTLSLTAAEAVSQVEARLRVPEGWTATPSQAVPETLEAGASAQATWEVTAPATLTDTTPLRLLAVVRGRTPSRYVLAEGEVAARVFTSPTGHLLGEDFESLEPRLGPSLDRPAAAGLVGWTAAAPEGWSVVNAPTMPQGTRDLQGWTFMTKRMWATGGQERADFSRGLGVLAVADPDDWDDKGSPSSKGRFDSTLVSPPVPIPSGATTLHLGFESHYRQESPQQASVTAVFSTGEERRLLLYGSAASGTDNAGADAKNRLVTKEIAVPSGATSVTLRFRVFDAGNNWYWAIDNVRLDVKPIR
ncbi:phosphocholine-specific phospholipase C [Nonomuraea dietziae]|uniref:phosphocholine-specific phospholipase C n=1 Tax=Nonomuraea dietziae TaxID=65515 RepID=UPI00343F6EE9